MVKPSDLPNAKEDKPMDSDEDDEVPQNEPGTFSTSKPFVPVLPLNQGPAASSQGPAASANSDDKNSEYSDEYSAQESGLWKDNALPRSQYPDWWWTLDNEAWNTQLCSCSRVILFCDYGKRRTTRHIYNLTTLPRVQQSLCLEEVTDDSTSTRVELPNGVAIKPETCWNVVWPPVEKPQEQLEHEKRRQPRKYEDTTSSLIKLNASSGNPGLTMRFLTSLTWGRSNRRTVWPDDGSIKTDKQINFLRAKARWVLRGFQDKQKESPADRFSCFCLTSMSDELPNGSQQKWECSPHWSQNSFPSKTILWCESWCRMSIATSNRSSTTYWCKTE